ncbi:hypothetical protein ACF061_28360 [Streptomyces sp. NPDC015220]|uniref:hypothetical protein n=1 Tax=Streptomyces sp. NPDC015220 TaxID=3364947 RepID=UPI0037029101
MTFVDDVLNGRATLDDLDTYGDAWNDSERDLGEFHDFLGLLWPEYAMWVEEHEVLGYVIEARRFGVGLLDLLRARRAQDPTADELYRLSGRYAAAWAAVSR